MRGYKAFNKDFTCRDYQFSENSEYWMGERPILCYRGFHFCTEMKGCFLYYPIDKDTILCEVEAIGIIVSEPYGSKHVTNHIKILNRIELDFDKLLDELSNHEDWHIRCDVANNPDTSIELLNKLSNDKYIVVRREVAENPNTSSDILDKLSDDVDTCLRYILAYNSNTSSNTLGKLSDDEDWGVRLGVARNPNTSIDVLIKLSNDVNEDVRYAVLINPKFKK
jgi:hypothetical protein